MTHYPELDRLAELAQKGELPDFLTNRYRWSKEKLQKYPHSIQPRWINTIGAISGLMALGGFLFAVIESGVLWNVSVAICAVGSIVVFITICREDLADETLRTLKEINDVLLKLESSTGLTPAQLSKLSEGECRRVARRSMIEACKEQLLLQMAHAGEGPFSLVEGWSALDHEIHMRLYRFIRLGLIDNGTNKRSFYDAARHEIAQAA
ncbi:hypothetical protein BH11PAT2_BH11PAT2_04560 [soil metagenome]